MEIIHVSAECYPVAKVGGLGDVVGALPKYLCKAGHYAKVVMPMHRTKFLYTHQFEVDFKGQFQFGSSRRDFTIIKEKNNTLGFDLYLVEVPGLTDRTNVYSYDDDADRFIAFQIAVVHWLASWQHRPDVVHCHDHHTALIPFMMKYCYAYNHLANIKTVFTIHNGEYQGWMGWNKSWLIPHWDTWKAGLLEWNNVINPMSSAIRCATKVTTVSPSYMQELRYSSKGLEPLFEYEKGKCVGILNGIDNEVWNPQTDERITHHYNHKKVDAGKAKNKAALCKQFGLDASLPLIAFIGRLVGEKAADILPDAFLTCLYHQPKQQSFFVIGSGDKQVEWRLNEMNYHYKPYFHAEIGYNETLAHQLYAAADFILMPSRVEPCGLNQLYALRYGTIPMVRNVGGLKDTVVDMGNWEGFGINFNHANIADVHYSVTRAIQVYKNKVHLNWMRQFGMQIDHSWESCVNTYVQLYKQ